VDLYEYQAKELFVRHGVPTTEGDVCTTPAEAEAVASKVGGPVVVKAQVKTGGRGKAGGVKLADNPQDAREKADAILGMDIKGHTVHRVLVAEASDIAQEYYVSFLLDRTNRSFLAMASIEGGVDIEEVAATKPEALAKIRVDALEGVTPALARDIADAAHFPETIRADVADILVQLWRTLVDEDATLVEVNPLVLTKDGALVALDAKMTFDDNALFRHKDVLALRDEAEEEPAEIRAAAAGLSYVKLDGTIGCLVNGAGLAMSTMDLVKLHGGEPANFLDVGGGADVNQVTEAFRIILSDANVKAILVNIFGGIMRCTTIANALVEASTTVGFSVPLVVRLEGTEVEEGKKILAESGTAIITADGLTDAAQKVVAASKA